MAKVDIKLPKNFCDRLDGLGRDFDAVAGEILEAGGEVVLRQVRAGLSSVVGHGTKYPSRQTGELVRSLGLSPPLVGKDGNHNIKVGFSEPRSDGGSNAKIANIIEYGRHNQPARPFLAPAKAASRAPCVQAMKDKLKELTGK